MDKLVRKTLKSLLANNFTAKFAETIEAAKQIILNFIALCYASYQCWKPICYSPDYVCYNN